MAPTSTFHPAPEDSNLSITELYEYHALNSPTHPLFAYSDIKAGTTTSISYRGAWKSIQRAAGIVSRHLSRIPDRSGNKRPVIAILAQSDTLSHIYLSLAIMSLGYIAFPMAPRNTAQITANLLKDTGVRYIFVDTSGPINNLAKEVSELLAGEETKIHMFPMIQFGDLAARSDSKCALNALPLNDDDTMLILHSSGTTNAPKPIRFSKRALINMSKVLYYASEVDLTTKRIAAHTNSTFHTMGVATYTWPLFTGVTAAVYKPEPIIPTPANYLVSLVADRCDIVLCVPVFIKAWVQNPAAIAALQNVDALIFSGASLDKDLGDVLTESGVVLRSVWGSTEIGPATMIMPRHTPHPREWEWFKLSKHVRFHMEQRDHLKNVFQPILIPSDINFPPFFNTTYMDKPAFSTGDLLEQHPSDPSRWRVYGRVDEQIVLSTGDNVNPLAMEAIITQDKKISAAVMFGKSRPHTGVIVVPAPPLSFDTKDQDQLAKFRDLVWPVIEQANMEIPVYGRIEKHMIVVATASKPIQYTFKGTARRAEVLRLYAPEISSAYDSGSVPLADAEFPDRAG
ncbi:acetyl-CoA synthetase-like protein [Mycena latifolia]|nr:acetyl-CoA synthetase-like protein [Mycena latifolia]